MSGVLRSAEARNSATSAFRTGGQRLEGKAERLDAVGARCAPFAGIVDEASVGQRLGGGEGGRASLQRLPCRQPGTKLGDMRWIDEAFACHEAEFAEVLDLALLVELAILVGDIGAPDFHRRVKLPLGNGLPHVLVSGGDIFDLVAGRLQHVTGNTGRDLLARPFVDGELDGLILRAEVGGLKRGCGQRREAGGDAELVDVSHCHSPGVLVPDESVAQSNRLT